jgi:hypothetical protein
MPLSTRALRVQAADGVSRRRSRSPGSEGPTNRWSGRAPRAGFILKRHARLAPSLRPSIASRPTDVAARLARVGRLLYVIFASLAVALWPTAATGNTPYRATTQCVRPDGVQRVEFSAAKYPNIRRHFRRAVLRRDWPIRLVLNRPGADERRERLLCDVPCATDSTATSTRRRSGGDVVRAWNAAATRAAGRQMCGT